MDRLKGVLKQVRALVFRRAVERELAEELSFHVEMAAADYERRGMSAEEARRMALISFGGMERYAERVREGRWGRGIEDVVADVRYAFRMFAHRPAFAAAVIATLGLGIGGTTAIFSVVDGLFMRSPQGVTDASTVRRIYIVRDEGSIQTPDGGPGSWVDYISLSAVPAFASMAAYVGPRQIDLGRGADAERVRASAVSAGYFDVLGVKAAVGRVFVEVEDAIPGAYPVAVISHGFWQTHFGGAAEVTERTLLLNGELIEIIGVAEEGFRGLHADAEQVWVPSSMAGRLGIMMFGDHEWRTSTGMAAVSYVARLAPDVDEAAAALQAESALRHAAEEDASLDPTPGVRTASLVPAAAPGGTGAESISLWLILVAGFVLIIACANVANLLLTRAITRRRELAVRLSLGAGRWRIVRQHLTESLVLALLGGAAGVLLAYWGLGLLRQFPLPPTAGLLDGRLLLFALGMSLLTGVLFGVLPALRSVQFDPVLGLKDGRAAGSPARNRTRSALVAVQLALSLALLVGAGLFVTSLRQVRSIDGGVDLERLLTASIDLRRAGYSDAEREAFYDQALARLSALPQVERAAVIHFEPFSGAGMSIQWSVPGRKAPDGTEGPYINMAGTGYFETAGTRLLAGRAFDDRDRAGGEPVAVVNEAMAGLMADDGDVVGRCVPLREQIAQGGCMHIIGVVETQRRRYLDDAAVPVVFLSRSQAPNAVAWGGPSLLVRTRDKPADAASSVRTALQSMRADLPYVEVRPLTELIERDVLPYRLGATLFSLFGILALSLAGVGLYGVLGYFVTERTAEIGIRRSLGAPVGAVLGLVVRQGMVPVAAGAVLGLAAALAGTRLLAALLFGVDARDPLIFGSAALFLIGTALVATLLPAIRAARVSPLVAMRSD